VPSYSPVPPLMEGRETSESTSLLASPSKELKGSTVLKAVLIGTLALSGATMTLAMKNQDNTILPDSSNSSLPFSNSSLSPFNSSSSPLPFLNATLLPPFIQRAPDMDSLSSEESSEVHLFHQPFFQLFHLGLGEVVAGIFIPFFVNQDPALKTAGFRDIFPLTALASIFDICAEVLVILGISLTLPSVTEMLKTTMVVFVGILSLSFFPGFQINWKQWAGSGFMLAGSLVVILENYLSGEVDGNTFPEIMGALLVIAAQVFYSLEFVVEERLIDQSKHRDLHINKAIIVVILGCLGMSAALILQVPWSYFTQDFSQLREDLHNYFAIRSLWLSGVFVSVAVVGFDLAGLAISELMGSDRRAIVVAAFQVVLVWSVSIFVGWEVFSFYSLAGFIAILLSGGVYVYFSKTKTEPHLHPQAMSVASSVSLNFT